MTYQRFPKLELEDDKEFPNSTDKALFSIQKGVWTVLERRQYL